MRLSVVVRHVLGEHWRGGGAHERLSSEVCVVTSVRPERSNPNWLMELRVWSALGQESRRRGEE